MLESLFNKVAGHFRIRTECEYLSILASFRIQSEYREKIEKKRRILQFFMAVATYFYYEKVHRTMCTAIILYLINICAFEIKSN